MQIKYQFKDTDVELLFSDFSGNIFARLLVFHFWIYQF